MDGFVEATPAPTLPPASDEQKAAVRALGRGNAVIESVAGSGKTTTVLFFAKVFGAMTPPKRILLLTYNAKLKLETRQRATKHGFENLEVHSYHSFCVSYCTPDGYTDRGILAWLGGATPPGFDDHVDVPTPLPKYDIIVVDEAQDMNFVYHDLVKRIMDVSPHAKICVLGDKLQSIYGFNGADPRFISLAPQVFGRGKWVSTPLSTSYRVTTQMCAWLNQLGCPMMRAIKDGPMPEYIYATREDTTLVVRIASAVRRFGANNVFVLAPSIRGSAKSPVNHLSNMLSRSSVPIFMPNDDTGPLDESVMAGKLVFSSFHQAKGLERKAVFVLGADMSYYTYYNTTAPVDRCPNELYVAMTRASEELTIVHWVGHDHMPFIQLNMIEAACVITGALGEVEEHEITDRTIRVTDLTRHHSSTDIEKAISYVKIVHVAPAGKSLALPNAAEQLDAFGDATYEDVSDINGTAIPVHYQLSQATSPARTIFDEIPRKSRAKLTWPPKTPAHLLQMSAVYLSYRNSLEYKVRQISNYGWLTKAQLDTAATRMSTVIPADSTFEAGFAMRIGGRSVSGQVDAMTSTHVYEIKCVSALTSEHALQVCLYALILAGLPAPVARKTELYNVMTGEHWRIEADLNALTQVCKTLIHAKYHGKVGVSDEEFLKRAGSCELTAAPCAECGGAWKCASEPIVKAMRKVVAKPVVTTKLAVTPTRSRGKIAGRR